MQRKISLIVGKTGSGKTIIAKTLILDYKRVIVMDSLLEYSGGTIFYSLSDLLTYIIYNEINNKSEFTFICRFTNDLDFEYLFKLVYELGNILLVVEEAEIYISPYKKQSSFLTLVRYGRHQSISIIGIARRTSELSLDFRSQTDTIYSLKQTNFNDLQNMERLGFIGLEKLKAYKYPEKILENIHYVKIDY